MRGSKPAGPARAVRHDYESPFSGKYFARRAERPAVISPFVVTLLDDVSSDAKCLLNILTSAYARVDRWPHRQYVASELAKAGRDLHDVLDDLPEWEYGYRAIRVLSDPAPLPNAPPELGDRLAPTVYGLVHSRSGDHMVSLFLASVKVGYARQVSFLPDPVKVKPVVLSSDQLIAGVRQLVSRPLWEEDTGQVRLMLAGEPATWMGVSPHPDSPDWEWKLWFRPLGPFAVDTGPDYLAALEQIIGHRPEPARAAAPVEPSALPRALDHLDLAWLARTGERLFKHRGFARSASLAEEAGSGDEFFARCNALYDVLSMLTLPRTDKDPGPLNLLKADLRQRITDPESLRRATEAVSQLQQVIKLRRGQAHSGAAPDSLKAAAQLGIKYSGGWAESWNQVRRITIDAVYTLIDELDQV